MQSNIEALIKFKPNASNTEFRYTERSPGELPYVVLRDQADPDLLNLVVGDYEPDIGFNLLASDLILLTDFLDADSMVEVSPPVKVSQFLEGKLFFAYREAMLSAGFHHVSDEDARLVYNLEKN